MTTAPLVSVILPVFNGERHLGQAIDSVLEQAGVRFELLIVDDGSSDGSATIIARYQERHPGGVSVLRHAEGKNRGVARSRNLAAHFAKGRYLAFIAQDDYWLPGKLALQVDFMERNPLVDLSYTRARIVREGDGRNFMPGVSELGDEPPAVRRIALSKVIAGELDFAFSSVMARLMAVRRAEGFPEDMPTRSDDRVLVARIAAKRRIGRVDEVLSCFRARNEHHARRPVPANVAPLVSVILPVFNGEKHVAQAIESVLDQDGVPCELLIVDDGSSDGSAAIIARYRERHPDTISVLRHEAGGTRGIARSRNLAARVAKGIYLAFIEQDDCWLPGKLERQVDFMERDPRIGLSYTRARIVREGDGVDFMPGVSELGDGPPADRRSTLRKIAALELTYAFSSVMARTVAVRKAGGFTEVLPTQSDDRALVARIAAKRLLGRVDEVLCRIRARDELRTRSLVLAAIAPLVSVILPVFNGERHLEQAVDSVLGQDGVPFELLIVDDGSSDGSAAIIARYQESHPGVVTLLRHEGGRNRGVARSRNLAAYFAKGTFLAFIDQDDYWLAGKLARQVEFMERDPRIGLSYTRARIVREGDGQNFMPGAGELGDEPPADRRSALYKIVAIEINYAFSAVMARTKDVRRAGGFPEGMPFQSDDRVLVARIAAKRRIGRVDEALSCFRAHHEHYTRSLVRANIAPVVFFDLQERVCKWLDDNNRREWARDISLYIMPRSYADAVFSLGQLELSFLLRNAFPINRDRKKGFLTPICRRCLRLRLAWRWRDPLREHLLFQRNYAVPLDRPEAAPGKPLVSVVVPVYNGAKYLAEALDSVLDQTYQQYEILVVDDGSTDGSQDIARSYAGHDPERIRFFTHAGGVNRGVAATRNLAIANARGGLIAFLDADDLWLHEKLELQVDLMGENPEFGLSYTDATIIREGAGHQFLPGVETLGHEPHKDCHNNLIGIITIRLNYIFSTVMVRTEAIRAVGGFLEHLPFQSEDRIMVAMVGSTHLVGRLPQILARYRAHGESYSASVVKAGTANVIIFDMQVKVIRWLLAAGQRGLGINLAARLLPGSFLRSLPRLRLKTLGPWLRDIASLAWRLPHLPLIVFLFHLTERARLRRNRG